MSTDRPQVKVPLSLKRRKSQSWSRRDLSIGTMDLYRTWLALSLRLLRFWTKGLIRSTKSKKCFVLLCSTDKTLNSKNNRNYCYLCNPLVSTIAHSLTTSYPWIDRSRPERNCFRTYLETNCTNLYRTTCNNSNFRRLTFRSFFFCKSLLLTWLSCSCKIASVLLFLLLCRPRSESVLKLVASLALACAHSQVFR